MATQRQLIVNSKSSFQPLGLYALKCLGPKRKPENLDHGAFEGKNHSLLSHAAASEGTLHKQAV